MDVEKLTEYVAKIVADEKDKSFLKGVEFGFGYVFTHYHNNGEKIDKTKLLGNWERLKRNLKEIRKGKQ